MWLDIIILHGDYIITSLFLIAICLGIAIVFLKNKREHSIILDINNYDERKKTPIASANNNAQRKESNEVGSGVNKNHANIYNQERQRHNVSALEFPEFELNVRNYSNI